MGTAGERRPQLFRTSDLAAAAACLVIGTPVKVIAPLGAAYVFELPDVRAPARDLRDFAAKASRGAICLNGAALRHARDRLIAQIAAGGGIVMCDGGAAA